MVGRICLSLAVAAVLLGFDSSGFSAQLDQNSYSKWDNSGDRIEKMVSELELVVDKASSARAADPNFLFDLRHIIQKYKTPFQRVYFLDDFSDGNSTKNPVWIVNNQDFSVDRHRSLFSSVTIRRPITRQGQNNEDPFGKIMGILGEMAGQSSTQTKTNGGEGGNSYIYSNQNVPNHFIMEYTFRSEATWGDVNIGLFHGDTTNSGYKIRYYAAPSIKRPLQIVKYSGGVSYVVKTAGVDSPDLDDGRSHRVKWQRSLNGDMTVSVDGKIVIQASDLSDSQEFNGIVIANGGGTFSFDNIKVYTER